MLGKSLRIRQWNYEATYDTIRHYCYGVGDENPLWMDESYAAKGPHGTIVAPPTFLYSVFGAGINPGFPGLQSFHGGGRWEFHRPVRRSEPIRAEAKLLDLYEKHSERAGRIFVGVGEAKYSTPDGEVVGVYTSRAIRVPRPAAGGKVLYEARAPHQYTTEELEFIEQQVLAERRRGAEPLYWEAVRIGDVVPPRVKGPLDFATMLAFYNGVGAAGYASVDTAIRRRHMARVAPETLPNNASTYYMGRGHLDGTAAESVGMPNVYDVGWQRIAWMAQGLTDWIGDLGRLSMIDVRLDLPNVLGDTVTCRAVVTSKETVDAESRVHFEVKAERQDGALSARGTATAVLPRRGD